MNNVESAKTLIGLLDLTTLNDNDTTETVTNLCQKATTKYGNTASVCIYPQFISYAKTILPQELKVATVINFPQGLANNTVLEKEIISALSLGADELDVVLPYKAFLAGDINFCKEYLSIARETCQNKILKIIIETGELRDVLAIKKAAQLCIDAQADFIKTSTGKTATSATPEAANAILETIAQSGKPVGFKASGGIKTLFEAKAYLSLAQSIMGNNWVTPSTFRIGASSLLNDLIKTIEQGY
jgi:deoxyribose-phosphate aldolase